LVILGSIVFEGDAIILKKRKLGKKILLSMMTIIIIISAGFIFINGLFKPLPEEKRNLSTSNIKMLVNVESNRIAIVRTYTKEEFDKFDENKINLCIEIYL